MKEAPGIDIVTRLYDLADLPFLDQLLFSVMGQVGAEPLRLHVMLQRFSSNDVRAVRHATVGLRRLNDRTSLTLHNWDYAAPFDLRVPLLNWGLEVAQGRYVIFLNVHDQLHSHACAALVARLRGTTAALALGSAVLQPVWWWGDVILPAPDPGGRSMLVPIFMIDAGRLAAKDRVFMSNEEVSETSEFLDRISSSYAVDGTHRSDVLAVRRDPHSSLEPHREV